MQQFLVYFYDRKSKPIKPTEQLIPPIKYLHGNVFLTRYCVPDQRVYDSFVKKAIQKKFYIALTKTCVNKDFRKSRIAFDVSLKVNRWALKFP